MNWEELWSVIWPILKETLIAALIAILALLGYDKYVPSRHWRKPFPPEEKGPASTQDKGE
jgi:hypothetical protein